VNWKNLGEITLLVVEDDAFNRQLIISILRKNSSINIIEAQNGKEALELLEKKSIDAMLLDIYMPIMNGFETLQTLRATKQHQALPVIVITSDEVEKKKTFSLGANDFIPKPFKLNELESKIYNLLAQR
jgi:CheY-like chemotaxis protein